MFVSNICTNLGIFEPVHPSAHVPQDSGVRTPAVSGSQNA